MDHLYRCLPTNFETFVERSYDSTGELAPPYDKDDIEILSTTQPPNPT
jgi:hypothetical protein